MNLLNEYLQYLNEISVADTNTVRDLSFELIHGRRLTPSEKRKVGGKRYRPSKYGDKIGVDYDLKESWLSELNKNKQISIFSVCQGHSPYYLAHVGFRTIIGKIDEVKFKEKLNKVPDTKCEYYLYSDKTIEHIPRFKNRYMWVVTCPYWYHPESKDKNKWEKWFSNISKSIGRYK